MSTREIRELNSMLDLLVSMHREAMDQIDRCCNIFETILDVDSEFDIDNLEKYR